MSQIIKFHIDLLLTVAINTENGCQNREMSQKAVLNLELSEDLTIAPP